MRISSALFAQMLQVVAGLDDDGAPAVDADDGLEGPSRVGPLVHLEVRLPEEQQRLGVEVGIGRDPDADRAGARPVVVEGILDARDRAS